jgi:hypothetical protein
VGEREGVEWVVREGVGAGGEMNQALFAHMNNKRKKISRQRIAILVLAILKAVGWDDEPRSFSLQVLRTRVRAVGLTSLLSYVIRL